ncbi:hypothetical protein Bca4012_072366 [Brassica carinata]
MSHFFQSREWMDRHLDPIRNCVSEEFMEELKCFLLFLVIKSLSKEQTLGCVHVHDTRTGKNMIQRRFLDIFSE